MNESDVIRALQGGVVAAVAQSDQPTLPVAYLDVAFTKPDRREWLEVVWVPNNVTGDLWGGGERTYRGLLRLILHWPNVAGGIYRRLDLLDSIARYFVKGLDLGGVQIYEEPDLTGVIAEGNETLYPVSIRYQSHRKGT